jgi:hypothetical protein
MSHALTVASERRPADDVRIIVDMSTISPELVLVDPALAETARARLPDPPDCLAPRPRAPIVPRTTVVARPDTARRTADLTRRAPLPAGHRPLDDPPSRRGDGGAIVPSIPAATAATRRRRVQPRHVFVASAWVVAALFVLSPLLAFLPTPSSELPRLVAPGSVAAVRQDGTTPASKRPAAPAPKPKPRVTSPDTDQTPARPTQAARRPVKKVTSAKQTTTPSASTVITWPPVPAAIVYNVIFVAGDERVDVWSKDNRLALDGTPRPASAETDYEWFAYAGFRKGKAVRYGPIVAHGTVRTPRDAIPETQPPAGGQTR